MRLLLLAWSIIVLDFSIIDAFCEIAASILVLELISEPTYPIPTSRLAGVHSGTGLSHVAPDDDVASGHTYQTTHHHHHQKSPSNTSCLFVCPSNTKLSTPPLPLNFYIPENMYGQYHTARSDIVLPQRASGRPPSLLLYLSTSIALPVPHVIPCLHPLKPGIPRTEGRATPHPILLDLSPPPYRGHSRRIHRLGRSRGCCGDGKYDARRPSSLRPLNSAQPPHGNIRSRQSVRQPVIKQTHAYASSLIPARSLPTYYRVTFDIENRPSISCPISLSSSSFLPPQPAHHPFQFNGTAPPHP